MGVKSDRKKALPILFNNKEECCGCSACYAICQMSRSKYIQDKSLNAEKIKKGGAITMLPDEKGFLYPVINPKYCVQCYKCVNICSFKTV